MCMEVNTSRSSDESKLDVFSMPIPCFTRIDSLSYGEQHAPNFIIHGENYAVLNSLLNCYQGSIRCVYIDPPYNNQEKYTHYTDELSHDVWLSDIKSRMAILLKLLTEDGSLWVSIDDREVHYLKILLDEIFGRDNFLNTIVWQQRTTRENRKVFSNNHEYLLVYAKDIRHFSAKRNLLPAPPETEHRYKNPDNDIRGPWQSVSLNVQAGHGTPNQFYELVAPSGRRHTPPKGRCWIYSQERMQLEITNNNIWFGKDGNGVPRKKYFLSESRGGVTPQTLWTADQVGTNDTAKKHLLKLFPEYPLFDTPKPEQLIRRILQIATNPGETVLDAYLGSGTTTAVAHKMGRHYIGIEEGSHVISHCVTRMRQVIDGESGGISRDEGWNGGGGFSFLRWVGNC
jgi:adenine-specific DNA-methyltransferase